MKIQIKSISGAVIYKSDKETEAIIEADLSGADLSWANLSRANLYRADLSGANLSGADLSGANLSGANLSGANLYRANLYRANLYWANLYRANLSGANLYGADLNWQSHDIIAELLRRWAIDDIEKRMLAGLILVSRDWCWGEFLAIDHKYKAEAIAELKRWLKPGQNLPIE